jgi:hypothetical protein
MPAEDSKGASVRMPSLSEFANSPLAGLFGERQNSTQLMLDSEIPGRPHIPSAFGKKQVDLGGPAPDAADDDELGDGGFVGFS